MTTVNPICPPDHEPAESALESLSLVDAKQVRRVLHCSGAQVYKLVATGRLPAVKIPCAGSGARKKHMIRFKIADLRAFIEKHYSGKS